MSEPSNWKVLVVDDEPDSLTLIHDMLTENGAQVYKAANGNQGLSVLESVQPTLIIVDLSMPHPDGWVLLNLLRANPALSHTPVVAITAYYSDEVERRVQHAGCRGCVRKPIRVENCLSVLSGLLRLPCLNFQ